MEINPNSSLGKRDYPTVPIQVRLAAYSLSGSVFHVPLLLAHKGFQLNKVWSRSGSQGAREKNLVEVVKNFDELLKDDAIRLVIINTPGHTHFKLSWQALLASKNEFVKKAFTATVQEARGVIKLAQDQGKIFNVFQNSRWHGNFITTKKIIQQT